MAYIRPRPKVNLLRRPAKPLTKADLERKVERLEAVIQERIHDCEMIAASRDRCRERERRQYELIVKLQDNVATTAGALERVRNMNQELTRQLEHANTELEDSAVAHNKLVDRLNMVLVAAGSEMDLPVPREQIDAWTEECEALTRKTLLDDYASEKTVMNPPMITVDIPSVTKPVEINPKARWFLNGVEIHPETTIPSTMPLASMGPKWSEVLDRLFAARDL